MLAGVYLPISLVSRLLLGRLILGPFLLASQRARMRILEDSSSCHDYHKCLL